MKTILQITEVSSGGVLPILSGICNGLADKYNIVVAYGLRPDTPKNINEYFDDRVKLVLIKSFTREISILSDIAAAKELIKLYREIRPDIIHMHSTKAGCVGRFIFMFCKVKKFYTPHGYCFLKKDDSICKRLIYRTVEWFLAQGNCITIACGVGEWQIAKKINKNAKCVNNGINIEEIEQVLELYNVSIHPFTVYTVGRIGPQKNPRQFNDIAKACPKVRFVWIGDGEDKVYLTSPNILITGFVEHKDVYGIACDCDCYISCSLWEGLPIALMEAMYMGKVCIVSNVNGNKDLILHGYNGIVVNETEEYIQQIMITKDKGNSQLGRNAHDIIRKSYNLKNMCEEYREIYK